MTLTHESHLARGAADNVGDDLRGGEKCALAITVDGPRGAVSSGRALRASLIPNQ